MCMYNCAYDKKGEKKEKEFVFFFCHCSDDAEKQYVWHTLIYCLKFGFCCCLSCLV